MNSLSETMFFAWQGSTLRVCVSYLVYINHASITTILGNLRFNSIVTYTPDSSNSNYNQFQKKNLHLTMRGFIFLAFTAMLACSRATPTSDPRAAVAGEQSPTDSVGTTLLDDVGYAAAWEDVLGFRPSNTVAGPAARRGIGPIDGQNSYVAYFYRKRRYVVTLVTVLPFFAPGLPDALTTTQDIASTVARTARSVMGTATGVWASDSWSFYSDVRGNEFTVVAKNMLPRNVQDVEVALKAAKALAKGWGVSQAVVWKYPQNNNKRAAQGTLSDYADFSILADFTPTVRLADYLFDAFHNANNTVLSLEKEDQPPSKRGEKCANINLNYMIRFNIVPWNTIFDYGCFGARSEFL